MEIKAARIFRKAFKLYKKGEYEKALKQCDKGLNLGIYNNNYILNLKAILLYSVGKLEDAVEVWTINSKYNFDSESEVYLKNYDNFIKRLKLYDEAEMDIREYHINDAIEKLEKCLDSNLNAIKVNNALAICYKHKGEIEKAIEYVNKSLSINKHEEDSKKLKKELKKLRLNTKKDFKFKIFRNAIVLILVYLSVAYADEIEQHKNRITEESTNISKLENIEENKIVETETVKNDTIQNKNNESKNQEQINADKSNNEPKKLDENEIAKRYSEAKKYYEKGDYNKATKKFLDLYKYSHESYLDQHVLFFIAASYEKDNMIVKSIEYYKKYIKIYTNGDYIEDIYYKLAHLYLDIDLNTSKEYAKIIKDKYPNSIYNNSILDKILKKK